MTSQEKKMFLGRYLEVVEEEKEIQEEITYWESKAEKITAAWSDVPGGGDRGDKVQTGAIKLAELRDMLNEKRLELLKIRVAIEMAINGVEDGTQRRLLRLRYIKGLTWEKISVEMNYSYVHTCRIHGYALQKIML